ncbi:uncharacterized protein TRUGW13939_11460 [Talaromyces rugulosus]|uniref:Uncharacterized protein n=1 Tax=Talaromyces rugulosus TaxID=121627 RepID=A0A7H8RDW3_TALRU|nr:uncharacterized protein TRUGW13939_11460 [Talaromyces rugulosus]QKX64287.1 hypothetical protein TRUGW13939_11460 [Talaromyces rugulosus]
MATTRGPLEGAEAATSRFWLPSTSLTVQETLTFPQLQPLCVQMLEDIIGGMLPECKDYNYSGEIQAHGGIQTVTTEILSCVRPEVLELQEQPVSRKALMETLASQDKDEAWTGPIGYLNFVTDTRCQEWFRLYVGQTNEPQRRIVNQHIQKSLKGSTKSLHYYMIWLGNGDRRVNFIRLWGSPKSNEANRTGEEKKATQNWEKIKMNLLEALFCKAFFTHHGMLNRCEPNTLVPTMTSYGLNVMSPLVYGGFKPDAKRSIFANALSNSPDIQIKYWLILRSARIRDQKLEKRRQLTVSRQIFQCDYDKALQDALGDQDLFQRVKDSLESEKILAYNEERSTTPVPYLGSLSAKVAFILDYGAVSEASKVFLETSVQQENGLPWALRGCGFTLENVLSWTYNFKQFSPLGVDNLSDENEGHQAHRSLILRSQARIFFLCGPRAANAVRPRSLKTFDLELRGFRYKIFVTYFNRLFIQCPALPSKIWSRTGTDSTKISEAIRCAISLLRLEGIRPYSLETHSIVGTILTWRRHEKMGKPPITVDKMDLFVALWVARKGIDKDTLTKIEQLAGSLPRALLMILHALRRYDEPQPPKRPLDPEISDQEHIQAIVQEATEAKEKSYNEALQGLPYMTSVRKDTELPLLALPESMAQMRTDSPEACDEEETGSDDDFASESESDDEEIEGFPSKQSVSGDMDFTSTVSLLPTILHQVRSLVSRRPAENQEVDDQLDVHIPDAAALCRDAIDQGFLSTEHPKRLARGKGQIWKKEIDKYENKEYRYQANPDPNVTRAIAVNSCYIFFRKGEDIGDGTIYVRIEIKPHGERHPNCYVPQALDTDPASRLGFLLRYTPSSGPERQRFAVTGNSSRSLYAANTFVNLMADGMYYEEIAKFPRRYIYLNKESAHGPELARFVDGGYTEGTPSV